ncbi:helix-turn-helix transcriptional regulator [Photorhabdus khanii subsp. guanajuatensis]|uniref:Helix-turn-helix transcriptional regulator n=2 Tax=Photorhabdus khanii TaxID=1004150 RepID=A0A4R4J6H4_9GAMM|nr:PAS domain-containing protein [Photorhabdus khanii]TDB49224.1 helix-turn-helix transcriptional regulator [Photorhabdus khanii subsp. guanajuatensis]
MENINDIVISPQIINTIEVSNDPWGIRDKKSCFIYANKAYCELLNLPKNYNVEGKYDRELPAPTAKFEADFQSHDRKVEELEQKAYSLETHPFGQGQILCSYLFELYPFYNDSGSCIGTLFHAGRIKDFSLMRLFYRELPESIMFRIPSEIFIQHEWDIIFLFLQKYPKRQIGQILNIPYRTLEIHISRIYHKIGVNSDRQLEEYCRLNDFHLYLPERFLQKEIIMFS